MNFSLDADVERVVNIKVVGVGGGGGNAVDRMIDSGIRGVEFLSMNTDSVALSGSRAPYKLQLGSKLTKGQGAGGYPERGQRAAEETRDEIASALRGGDLVFITAGMGGGTGTGGAPVVAEIAQELGILTVGVVTKPFNFEGRRRMEQAEMGITALRDHVDALLIIPNDRLQHVSEEKITFVNAFSIANDVLRQAVQSISDIINFPGLVNVDFSDVTTVIKGSGYCHMGTGRAAGKDRAKTAALAAISSPLLETSINGARGVLVNVTAPTDVGLDEVAEASSMIHDATHPDVNLIWGVTFNDELKDEMIVTVIATGFEADSNMQINYTFKSPAKADTAPADEGQAAEKPAAEPPEEDPFNEILKMFHKS